MTPSLVGVPASWCEYEYWRCSDGCPLRAAEGRLREAHRSWHGCASSYQQPEDFRGSLNTAIQALRNVTFLIQKVKSQLPGFDSWYANEQAAMKADPLLKWSLGARNYIVKEGDLDTQSILHVSLVCSYENEAASVSDEQHVWGSKPNSVNTSNAMDFTRVPVGLSLDEIFDEFARFELPLSVRQDATVTVERRWVDENNPDYELLSALAYVFGAMNSLLTRAHELLGMRAARVHFTAPGTETEDGGPEAAVEYLEQLPLSGRLPCMASTRHIRAARYRLIDRSLVDEFRSHRVVYEPEIAHQVRESGVYGPLSVWPHDELGNLQTSTQLAGAVRHYSSLARGILESGQDHGWFTYYYQNGASVGARVHVTIDRQGKQAIAAEIARAALEYDADAVILVSEVWTSPMQRTPDGAYIPPSLHESRTEAVIIDGIARSGARAGGILPFHVIGGEPPNRIVEVGAWLPQNSTTGLLLPTLSAWGVANNEPLQGANFWRAQRRRL
ncbi:hypothetical protein [Nocardia sp. 348MFTsu5.1]|uniref:hypothetical protein n=1 Tax=Nocardia sp. 348MFTsu5.1 TaxID=1172185 RepID=UPI0012DCFF9A|nr:hypothetical protein [Nocardia sp. 348MFTsu5.1]